MQIHVARDGKQLGVFSLEEINRQIAAGTLNLTDLAWHDGAAGWVPLSSVAGVGTTPAAVPAQVSPVVAPQAAPVASGPIRKTEPLAIVSLICSIAGLFGFCCGLFMMAGIAGIVCGHLALTRFKENPQLDGRGLAVAGLAIGYLGLAGWLLWIFLFGGLAVLQGITESMGK